VRARAMPICCFALAQSPPYSTEEMTNFEHRRGHHRLTKPAARKVRCSRTGQPVADRVSRSPRPYSPPVAPLSRAIPKRQNENHPHERSLMEEITCNLLGVLEIKILGNVTE
jgi:hypothetical protein